MPTDSISAPFSYTGSTERIWHLVGLGPTWLLVVEIPVALALIVCALFFVTLWYLAFGLLALPYRAIRRGQRKRAVAARRHTETIDAIRGRP